MEFVICSEHNYISDTTRIYYIQWNGNEDALTMVHEFITDDDFYTSSYTLSLNLDIKIPESIVNIHCNINNGIFEVFKKCIGKLEFDNMNYDTIKDTIDRHASRRG